jgi:hypothetical protein
MKLPKKYLLRLEFDHLSTMAAPHAAEQLEGILSPLMYTLAALGAYVSSAEVFGDEGEYHQILKEEIADFESESGEDVCGENPDEDDD